MNKEYIGKIIEYKKHMYIELKKANMKLTGFKHILYTHIPYDMREGEIGHIKYKKFEWQYWVGFKDGKVIPEDVPEKYMKEMLAHMIAISIMKKEKLSSWYFSNNKKMILSESTKYWLENRIAKDLYW